jgi:hypothetical protein
MSGQWVTKCAACGNDPCSGWHTGCSLDTFYAGNLTNPAPWLGTSEAQYQCNRRNYLGIKPSAMFIDTDQLMYDPGTGYWVLRPKEGEQVPPTQRKCECGVWSTGGLHSDWCPCAGGDCVQKENR